MEKRFRQAEEQEFKNIIDLLPRKQLTWIPSEAVEIQRQIRDIFDNCLDRDLSQGTVNERLTSHFKKYQDDSLKLFRFQKLNIKYEMEEDRAFTDVLYPEAFMMSLIIFCGSASKENSPSENAKTARNILPSVAEPIRNTAPAPLTTWAGHAEIWVRPIFGKERKG